MEILQIVAGPLSVRPLAQNFAVRVAFAAPVDFGEILEKSRSGEAASYGSVMVGGSG